ncbi:MAG: hypothetical protein WC661_04375 [Opitutaceae bacterium]
MPSSTPSPTTLRLMACVESFARDEDGAIGHDDWPALAGILERELALLQRIASETPPAEPGLVERATKMRQRYTRLSERILAARIRDAAELAGLGETARRVQAVRHAYARA